MPDRVSHRIRGTFRDASSQVVLRDIDRMWEAEGFQRGGFVDSSAGQRVTRWKEFELGVDWSRADDSARVIRVYETFLSEWQGDVERFTRVLRLDGWIVEDDRRIVGPAAATLSPLSGLGAIREPSGILDAYRRIELLMDDDPGGVIGAVKELIEATAKTVLEDLSVPYAHDESVSGLISKTQTELGLAASSVDPGVDNSASVKRVLGGLSAIANGINELRNSEGAGHGRPRGTNLTARHSRLAINVGRTWCELILDTLDDPGAPWRARRTNA